MIRRFAAAALALWALVLAIPASAQERWRHEASGISIAREIGDMRLRDERDLSGGAGTDILMQFGSGDTVVTFYVYRPPYPNVALWFERTRIGMGSTVGSDGVPVRPRSFTFGGASAPNGLREELDVAPGNMMQAKTTAVAMVQLGEWMVKGRVSSRTLDRAGTAAVMDRLLGAVRVERAPAFVLPIAVPPRCANAGQLSASPIPSPDPAAVSAAADGGQAVHLEIRGVGGLAANPQGWCREVTQVPPQYGSVYRRQGGAGWVALLGDSAYAVTAERLALPGSADAAVFASTSATTQLAALYDGLPAPDPAIIQALPIVGGREQGLAEVRRRR
ncbi:MAG TPA: hypothetical protein VGB08_00655 [Allosphingosinicella sp.]|jgi:hypothetical protein